MKIAMTGNVYPFGEKQCYGGERVIYYLIQGLHKLGHEIYLFANKGCSVPSKYIKDYTPTIDVDGKDDYHLNAIQSYIAKTGISFDVYQCNYFTDGWREAALNIAPVYAELIWCRWCHIKWQLHRTPWNTISYSWNLQAQMTFSDAPTTMIHYGIPKDLYQFSPEHDDYAVWIGKIEGGKAPHLAIELALAAGMKIVILGPPYNPFCMKEEIVPYLDNKRVFWLRGVDDEMKQRVMSRAKVFISSNKNEWTEAFGIVNAESLACGTPVLGFTSNRNPSAVETDEIIIDGENGFLLHYDDSNNVNEILDKGVPLLNKIGEIDRRKCRESFENRFTADLMGRRYDYLYNHVMTKGNVESLQIPF